MSHDKEAKSASQLVDELIEGYARQQRAPFYHPGPEFPLIRLQPGRVLGIASGPGNGKTSLVLQMFSAALQGREDLTALMVNVEMTAEDLTERLFSIVGGIRRNGFEQWPIPQKVQDDVIRFCRNHGSLLDRMMFCDDLNTIDDVHELCLELKPTLVCIDYLQRFRNRDNRLNTDPRTRVDTVCRHHQEVRSGRLQEDPNRFP